jgi:hypothetical protein
MEINVIKCYVIEPWWLTLLLNNIFDCVSIFMLY